MEIEFTKQMVPCCRRCFRQAKIITDHVDCVVPDVLEDIGKMYGVTKECIRQTEARALGKLKSGLGFYGV